MTTYRHDIIRTMAGAVIHLKFVESFVYKQSLMSDEDKIIDILSGKTILIARMISGAEHEILIENTLAEDHDTESTAPQMVYAIVRKWVNLNSEESGK